jgi:nucleotide-binding universal stress UspA family protein/predicted Zn-ribbon and HTH transcriptional regulator
MFKKIYVPLDNSDHSMASAELAIDLAKRFDSELVGCHAYAARMHDIRFRQMEFTLPSEYQVEEEMEKQRNIHDTLITMGLELISDSYLQVMKKKCEAEQLPFEEKMMDGRNFKVLVDDINNSDYDLVIIGALGLGAVRDSVIGSVCERVVRRTKTDTLVIKNISPLEDQLRKSGNGEVKHELGNGGNIVVCIDGSPESFAGLRSAISLGKAVSKEVEAIAVYDPYLHYTMFNSIVNVLTEKAAKVFKFKEQEQLHEDVIDTGLAKIYHSHLEVARKIAKEDGINLKITLLDGKAFEKIIQYVRRERPWLLVIGRIGVHSDEEMDVGSNTENLLRLVPCNIFLSSKRYTPAIDIRAEESMTWTEEATAVLNTAPDGVRGIARTTIHRWAMERGHSVITRKVIENSMASILPEKAMRAMGIIAEEVAIDKGNLLESETYICRECGYAARDVEPVICPVCNGPADGFQKIDKQAIESLVPLEGGVEEEKTFDNLKLKWTSGAKQALRGVPSGYQRRRARAQIEKSVRVRKLPAITRELVLEVAGDIIEETRNLEERGQLKEQTASATESVIEQHVLQDGEYGWTAAAVARLNRVPEGFMRDQTKERIVNCAKDKSVDLITLEIAEDGLTESRKAMAEMIERDSKVE